MGYRPGMWFTRMSIASGQAAKRILDQQRGNLNDEDVQYYLHVIREGKEALQDLIEVYGNEYVKRWLKASTQDGDVTRQA